MAIEDKAVQQRDLARDRARRQMQKRCAQLQRDPCIRAENEDDDGYDPYSDRRPEPEPLFEENPWG